MGFFSNFTLRGRASDRTSAEPPPPPRGPFGRPLAGEPLTDVAGLAVPAVLAALWEALVAAGLEAEGIFRLSADFNSLNRAKAALAAAGDDHRALVASLTGVDEYALAALIKAWLRELPDDLWEEVRSELEAMLDAHAEEHDAGAPARLVSRLSSRKGCVVVFIVRLMAAVHARESSNLMGIGAIATVFAPGLVRPGPESELDPSLLMEWTDHAVRWASTQSPRGPRYNAEPTR